MALTEYFDATNVSVYEFDGESVEDAEIEMNSAAEGISFQYDVIDGKNYVSVLKENEFDDTANLTKVEVV